MTEQRNRIGMREAVDIALSTMKSLYPDQTLEDLLLEEVLLSGYRGQDEWEVTLGFTRPYVLERPGSLSNVLPQAKPRAYKRFLIDPDTGEVKGMVDGRIDID